MLFGKKVESGPSPQEKQAPRAVRVATVETIVLDNSGFVVEIVRGKTADQVEADYAKSAS